MSNTTRRAFLALASSALLTAGLGETVTALNTSPAVNIRRIGSLYQAVWPGDFNGDGVIDLVGSNGPTIEWPYGPGTGAVRIALGNGDGTFKAAINSPFAGRVLGVGDLNKDARLDVVVAADYRVHVLAGNGDGTLSAQHPIEGSFFDAIGFALVADFDGDRNLDVALDYAEETYSPELRLFAGRGDFAFEPAMRLVAALTNAVSADFNRDGRPDIAGVSEYFDTVTIYLNHGAFVFTASDIPLDHPTDIASGDVNGDGKLDLLISAREKDPAIGDWWKQAIEGSAYVLPGRGDGTFGTPARYDVAPGALNVVVGDFTRDGVLDIATSNWSSLYVEDCAPGWETWDSVSILPGKGDGTFAAASSFSLGNQLYPESGRFRNTATSLNTADLNGDGAADLIASQGAILINTRPDPNWAPKVSAGADQVSQIAQITLRAAASDADQDMLTYRWSDSAGTPIPPVPTPCVSVSPGVHVFTVTVSDGHGHETSASVTYRIGAITPPAVSVTAPKAGDVVPANTPMVIKWTTSSAATLTRFDLELSNSGGAYWSTLYGCTDLPGTARECQWNGWSAAEQVIVRVYARDSFNQIGWGDSGVFRIQNGFDHPWSSGEQDIGSVATAGSGSFDWDSGVSTIAGSGKDIWGTADAFHYAYERRTGPFEITVRVNSLDAVHLWTKAGLMIRETLAAGSRHVSLFATPGKGLAFQRRMVTNGSSLHTAGPFTAAPVWLKLARTATSTQAFYRKNTTDFWIPLATADTTGWPAELYFGLAVTSHVDGTLASATFSRPVANPTGEADLWGDESSDVLGGWGPLPAWSGRRIGTTTGEASWNPALITVNGNGSDIWGTADRFYYLYVPVRGNATITARVRSVQNTHVWAKAGVMFREALTTTSKHVMAVVTPGKGLAMQYRASAGGLSANVALAAGAAPEWLHLRRSSDTITAWSSNDYVTWTKRGTVNVSMAADVLVGLAVTSHNTATTAQAVFDDVLIVQ